MASKEQLALLVARQAQRDSLARLAQAVALLAQQESVQLAQLALLEAMELMARLEARARLESKAFKEQLVLLALVQLVLLVFKV
jgi:hypothetical protein